MRTFCLTLAERIPTTTEAAEVFASNIRFAVR